MRAFVARWFDFRGRTTREEFWRSWWALGLTSILPAIPVMAWMAMGPRAFEQFDLVQSVLAVVEAPFGLAWMALFFRRMHDRGRSGFWVLAFDAFVLLASPFTVANPLLNGLLFGVFAAAAAWLFVELAFLPTTTRANRYSEIGVGEKLSHPPKTPATP